MARPRKKEINLTKDSVLALMQEIYNELVEQRAVALRIQNKMLAVLKDAKDMPIIGPVIKEQQKIINDTIEKKITLSKLQSAIWEKAADSSEETFDLADVDQETLDAVLKKDLTKTGDGGGYKLK